MQPEAVNCVFPAAGSPAGVVEVGNFPTTVWATGETTLPPQPVIKNRLRIATGQRRRTGATVPFEP